MSALSVPEKEASSALRLPEIFADSVWRLLDAREPEKEAFPSLSILATAEPLALAEFLISNFESERSTEI